MDAETVGCREDRVMRVRFSHREEAEATARLQRAMERSNEDDDSPDYEVIVDDCVVLLSMYCDGTDAGRPPGVMLTIGEDSGEAANVTLDVEMVIQLAHQLRVLACSGLIADRLMDRAGVRVPAESWKG